MKRGWLLPVFAVLVLAVPAVLTAQMREHPSGPQRMGPGRAEHPAGPHMMGPGMRHNMDRMSGMMRDMHGMMDREMTPEQQRQMQDMMNQMGRMMQEMSGPEGARLQDRHQHQLQEMQRRLEEMQRQMQGR